MHNPSRHLHTCLIVGLLLISINFTNVLAGEKSLHFPSVETDVKPLVRPVRIDEAPNIDGHLHDAIWQQVDPVENFTQTVPVEGATASEATEV